MRFNPLTRRQFLVGAGGALLAIPLLPSLLPESFAQTAAKKRFVCLGYDNGRFSPHWYPTAAQEAPMKAVAGVEYMREMRMSEITGNISQIFSSSQFNGSIRDKMMLIRGLDGFWANRQGHQWASILCGNIGPEPEWVTQKGPSIDYLMAKNIKSNPQAANPNSYLNLGVWYPQWELSYKFNPATNTQEKVGRIVQPSQAFDQLFKNYTTPPAPTTNQRRKLAVDRVLENYKAVVSNPKLSKAEKQLLQDHIDSLVDLEKSITTTTSTVSSCTPPTRGGGNISSTNDATGIERVNRQNVELMAAAIKCGIVNIGTIMLNWQTDNCVYTNLGVTTNYHGGLTHTTMNSPSVLKITTFMAGFFGQLINSLNVAEPGTNGTFLDNSLIQYSSVMGDGTRHSYDDMPVMMAGGLGGKVRTGRYLDYSNRAAMLTHGDGIGGRYNTWQGRNYSAFLVTLMTAMGLSPADWQQPNVSEGFGSEISGSPATWRRNRKDPLPGFLA